MRSNSRRKELLIAASYIVKHQGMDKLTLEAVASQAGVSKGGLLHHFPNKDSLIKAMIDEYSASFLQDIRERAEEDHHLNGKWHRAYLEATLHDTDSNSKIVPAYTAAMFTDPALLSTFKDDFEKLYLEMSQDGLDEVTGAIIRLAIEGLWYAEVFNIGNLEDELKQRVCERLSSMINKTKDSPS